jgi:hypothetical protein
VRLVGCWASDFDGIGLKERKSKLWISYFTTTLNGWGIRCATFRETLNKVSPFHRNIE